MDYGEFLEVVRERAGLVISEYLLRQNVRMFMLMLDCSGMCSELGGDELCIRLCMDFMGRGD